MAKRKAKDGTEGRDLVEQILRAAERHGLESEPDHEVGDLQDALREAWDHMTPEQRKAAFGEMDLWGADDEPEEG